MSPLRSKKYLAGSKGATCKLMIPGVCSYDSSTVVPVHIRDRHTGRGQKASDLSVVDGCHDCHAVFDRRRKMPHGEYISEYEWWFYALRALQDTLEARHELGLLIIPLDAPRQPKVRQRKPKGQRAKIPSRKFPTRSVRNL